MIKIEVTGNSIAEVADKLLAIGGSLRAAPVKGATSANIDPVMPEVAEMAPAPEPTQPSNATEVATPEPQPSGEATTPPASASESDTLRTLVLAVVAAKGRDAMTDVLSTFGLAKASDVPQEQYAELVETLEALL